MAGLFSKLFQGVKRIYSVHLSHATKIGGGKEGKGEGGIGTGMMVFLRTYG